MNCRICHDKCNTVYDFGNQPLANGYSRPQDTYPLELVRCKDCKLYQLAEVVPPDELFTDYAYRSGAGGMQQALFRDLVKQASRFLKPHDMVVDIGCNDGALLTMFTYYKTLTIGVEPYPVEGYTPAYPEPWSGNLARRIHSKYGCSAKIMTATNVWAHIDDLHEATEAVATLLALDGKFIIQVPWVRDFLNNNLYDTIYHEHLSYFGVKQLRTLFQRHWMDVHHVDYLPNIHGGTIRCWIGHGNTNVDGSVTYVERMEKTQASPKRFERMVDDHAIALQDALGDDEWTMYGCSAKATMLVNIADITHTIVEAVDDTPEKQGKTLPGTDITISDKPTTDRILITAWNYADAIKRKLSDSGWHGKLCIPMPVPRIESL